MNRFTLTTVFKPCKDPWLRAGLSIGLYGCDCWAVLTATVSNGYEVYKISETPLPVASLDARPRKTGHNPVYA